MAVVTRDSMRLYDLSDRELAAIITDVRDQATLRASRKAIAAQVFPHVGDGRTERAKHAMRCVAVRLAWMRRYGVVEKVPGPDSDDSYWQLTPLGESLLRNTLNAGEQQAIEGLSDDRLVVATQALTDKYVRTYGVAATMMRRAWMHGTHRR